MKLHPRINDQAVGPTCIDLFSGAGGLAVGFRAAGWAILAANDLDPGAGETFRLNFPEADFFEGPISGLNSRRLMEVCGLARSDLDCLIGGPPCQSFSYNNHHRSAADERARLFEHYLRIVEGLSPKTLLMENVPGILTIGDGAVIEEISSCLEELGYDVAIETLSAEEFGTPQVRRRVFIAASLIGDAVDLIPSPTHAKGKRNMKRLVTVGNAIGDLPIIRNAGGAQVSKKRLKPARTEFQREMRRGARELHNHACRMLTDVMLERIRYVPEGGNWRDIPFDMLPAGMQRARESDHTRRYGRLSRDGLATTLLTKCDPHWGSYVHPTQNRTISVREAARLQGFPDTFRFAGNNIGKQYAQVGNAVPVPVARALGAALLSHLSAYGEIPRLAKAA